MEKFFLIFIVAILIEGIVSYVIEVPKNPKLLVPIVLGIIAAIAYRLDIPAEMGAMSQLPFLGSIFTGIILARGSNYLYDIVGWITGVSMGTFPTEPGEYPEED